MLHARNRQPEALEMPLQATEAQEAVRIGADLEFEIGYHLGRDPTGAQLEAWKARLVEHQHIRARRAQPLRGRGAGRTAVYDNDLGTTHARDSSARVHELARQRNPIILARSEQHLEQLQG